MSTYPHAKPAGTPTWIDLMTPDVDAARAFYQKVFGWKIEQFPMPAGGPEYYGVTTRKEGEDGINGGLMTNLRTYYPVDGNSVPAHNNGALETDPGGLMVFSWAHPRDPRESATYELPGKSIVGIRSRPGDPRLAFDGAGRLRYTLPGRMRVGFRLLDARGKSLARLDAHQDAGAHAWALPARVAPGAYLLEARLGGRRSVLRWDQD